MDVLYLDAGRVEIETAMRHIGPDYCIREIVGIKWEGSPFAPISEEVIRTLPAWARVGYDLIEIGPYILRRTADRHVLLHGHYWVVVGHGEWYWLYWRMMRFLEGIWWRVLLTLAVWRVAEWPAEGSAPCWTDVVRRWQRKRKDGNG